MAARPLELSVIVPTRDRPAELARMLRSLAGQARIPAEVIVVDSGRPPAFRVVEEFRTRLPIRLLESRPPSASRQRNVGIRAAGPSADLIGLFDDDIVLAPGAMEAMMEFWESAGAGFGGASFNLINHPSLIAAGLKSLPWVERWGLYGREPGRVLPSGFQTLTGTLQETRSVEWLSSGASVWRRQVFDRFVFDEWYAGYSYLEDLDFSYAVGRRERLAVVAPAGYFHYPGAHGRGSGFVFGRREVLNRLHFVRKHPELSMTKCRVSLILRIAISLRQALRETPAYYLGRAAGGAVALAVDGWKGRPKERIS